jgi:hypothetical protein
METLILSWRLGTVANKRENIPQKSLRSSGSTCAGEINDPDQRIGQLRFEEALSITGA